MSKYVITVLIGVFILGSTQTVEAQLLRRLKDKAEERIVQKVEEKIDEKLQEIAYKQVDKSWESIFGKSNTSTSQDGDERTSGSSTPFMMNSSVETADRYRFNSKSKMFVTTTNENGDTESVEIHILLSEDGDYTGSKYITEDGVNENVLLVYDYERDIMIMLGDSDEGKYSFAYDWQQTKTSNDEEVQVRDGFEEIGSRKILGIDCTGYSKTENNYTVEIWVADSPIEGFEDAVHANSSTRFLSAGAFVEYTNGTILEMKSSNTETGEAFTLEVASLKEKTGITFDMDEYPVIGMN